MVCKNHIFFLSYVMIFIAFLVQVWRQRRRGEGGVPKILIFADRGEGGGPKRPKIHWRHTWTAPSYIFSNLLFWNSLALTSHPGFICYKIWSKILTSIIADSVTKWVPCIHILLPGFNFIFRGNHETTLMNIW